MDNHNNPADHQTTDTAPEQALPGEHSTPNHSMLDHSSMGYAGMDHDDHAIHSEGQHAEHSIAMFKNRFWLTLLLSIPVVFFSPMFGHLLRYSVPQFLGSAWIPPCWAPLSSSTAAIHSSPVAGRKSSPANRP